MIDWVLDDKWCVCSAGVSSHDGKVSDLLVSLVSLLLKVKSLQFWSWMFFQSPDLTAGSTDAFWSFDSCATILGQPALRVWKKMQDIVQNRSLEKILCCYTYTGNDAWGNIYRFQHYVWIPDELLHQMSRVKQEKNNLLHMIFTVQWLQQISVQVWLIIKSKIFTCNNTDSDQRKISDVFDQ